MFAWWKNFALQLVLNNRNNCTCSMYKVSKGFSTWSHGSSVPIRPAQSKMGPGTGVLPNCPRGEIPARGGRNSCLGTPLLDETVGSMITGVWQTLSSLGSWGLAAGPPGRGVLLWGSAGFCVRSCPRSESESLWSLFPRLDYERITNDLFCLPQRAVGGPDSKEGKLSWQYQRPESQGSFAFSPSIWNTWM